MTTIYWPFWKRWYVPPVLPIDADSSLTDVRLDLVCRCVAGRDVDPVARGAALVGCLLMARGEESAAQRVISRAEIALGWWSDEPLTDRPDRYTVSL